MRDLFLAVAIILSILAVSCKKHTFEPDDPTDPPSPEPQAVSVSTLPARNIHFKQATLAGRLQTGDKAFGEVEVKFYYSLIYNTPEKLKTTKNQIVADLKEDGTFQAEISELLLEKNYWFMASARLDGKEIFGEVLSFETLSPSCTITLGTPDVSQPSKVVLSATLDFPNGETLSYVTFNYSETLTQAEDLAGNDNFAYVPDVGEDGRTVSATLTDLLEDTDYHYVVVVYVEEGFRKIVSEVGHFRPGASPSGPIGTVTGHGTCVLKSRYAELLGELTTGDYRYDSRDCGFLVSETADNITALTTTGTAYPSTGEFGSLGEFKTRVDRLKPGTRYYYVPYVHRGGEYAYGDLGSFLTPERLFSLSTSDVSAVTGSSAAAGGKLLVDLSEGFNVSETGILWRKGDCGLDDIRTGGSRVTASRGTDGVFSGQINGLQTGTLYSYAAYAVLDGETFYGKVRHFTTHAPSKVCILRDATLVTPFSATLSAWVNGDYDINYIDFIISPTYPSSGQAEDLIRNYFDGVVLSRDSAPCQDGRIDSVRLMKLIPGQTYYYAVYYSNADKSIATYSEIKSFVAEAADVLAEPVDMGVASGTKWSCVNLGQKQPAHTVNYSWGEPWTKDYFFYTSYRWFVPGTFQLIKYCTDSSKGYNGFSDGKSVMDAEDNPVAQILGGNWRLPTHQDWEELTDTEKFDWSTSVVDGVKGWLVISKITYKWLFFPQEGLMAQAGTSVGFMYWCDALSPGNTREASCALMSGSAGLIKYETPLIYANRFEPGSIRPVCGN